jgi:hypothetical protein
MAGPARGRVDRGRYQQVPAGCLVQVNSIGSAVSTYVENRPGALLVGSVHGPVEQQPSEGGAPDARLREQPGDLSELLDRPVRCGRP